MFLPQEVIRAKRDGHHLDASTIDRFVAGLTDGTIADAQVAAFAMAVYFRGLDTDERVALTSAMARSGTTMSWPREVFNGPILDKHSTGGVGDKVSLMLAPLVAACGGIVPMISGRGLGHTGGTFDKMESIPGYNAAPDSETFHRAVREVGCAIIGQTDDLAPADRRLYGIRDVTATVESIGLITASILSKKLAAGLDALVMDVTFGNGAFMADLEAAQELATSIVDVANGAGLATVALLTDMNQVLGRNAGNAVEVVEAVQWLAGASADPRLDEVVFALGAELLVLGGLAPTIETARSKLLAARSSGAAAERFARMVAALGGPTDLVDRLPDYLPTASIRIECAAIEAGFVNRVDTRRVGMAVVGLGGGRTSPGGVIDHAVGLVDLVGIGEIVDADHPIGVVLARDQASAERAVEEVRAAYEIGSAPLPQPEPAVRSRVTSSGVLG